MRFVLLFIAALRLFLATLVGAGIVAYDKPGWLLPCAFLLVVIVAMLSIERPTFLRRV